MKKLKEEAIKEEKTLKLESEIDNKKIKEIEKVFKNSKLKVYLSNPINLENGKICSISKGTIQIYENIYFNKLYVVQSSNKIEGIIQLDNKDIIALQLKEEENTILIYRLSTNKNYFLFQTIKENRKGYKMQFTYSGIFADSKTYSIEMIKRISGNRFITVSNYGFKIYSLDENNQYSLILFETHLEGIKYIYEIDNTNLIFCTEQYVPEYMDSKPYNYLLIEKIKLISIKRAQNDEKLKKINFGFKKGIDCNEISNIETIKFTYDVKIFCKYFAYDLLTKFSEFVVLKNKYLIIMVNLDILIFDLIKEKRYKVLKEGIKNLYLGKFIKKWNNNNDNEFIVINNKKISLFELNENIQKENIKIELKLIAYSTFNNIKNIEKIGEENKFYRIENDYILLY